MFRIKICGVTNSADAQAAVDAGADAIGLNFYRGSKRFVTIDDACQIARCVPDSVSMVGVFVNHDANEIGEAVEQLRLKYIQLHGDEPPQLLTKLPRTVPIVRANRCTLDSFAMLASYLDECDAQGRRPDAVLMDSGVAGGFGGTGHVADWSLIDRHRAELGDVPLILAGGLTPDNVAAAIAAVRPDGVDVASGVELAPGRKSGSRIKQFVAEAREAFARL